MKGQMMGFARFGLYISIFEIPLEIIMGKVNGPAMFVSGGLAGVLLDVRPTFFANVRKFLSTGAFIGLFGAIINRGSD